MLQQQTEKPSFAESVNKIQRQILREATDDACVRNAVLTRNQQSEDIINFISSRICAFPLSFTFGVCEPTELGECKPSGLPEGVEIYADDTVIAVNLTMLNPTKLVLYSWLGKTECVLYECKPPTAPLIGAEVCGDGVITPVIGEEQ